MKKNLKVIIIAVILAAAAALTAVIVINSKNSIATDDPDCLYKYKLKRDGKGIAVTVTGDFGEGYSWINEDSGAISTEAVPVKNASAKGVFNVTSTGDGAGTLALILQKDAGIISDAKYEIDISFYSDISGTFQVAECSHKELSGSSIFDEEKGHSYAYSYNSEGNLVAVLEKKEDSASAISIDNPGIVMITPEESEATAAKYDFMPMAEGKCTVKICSVGEKKALELSLDVNENYEIKVKSHKLIDYDYNAEEAEKPEKDPEEPGKNIETNVKLLSGAVLADKGEISLRETISSYYDAEWLIFTMGEDEYTYYASPESPATIFNDYCGVKLKTEKKVKVGESAGKLYESTYGFVVIWQNSEGTTFAVENANKDNVLTVASELYAMNPVYVK